MSEPQGATMDYSALEAWCKTLSVRLEDAERRAQLFQLQYLLEVERNEVQRLRASNQALIAESIRRDEGPPRDEGELQVEDPLLGLLAKRVASYQGKCLVCHEFPALYCGLECARRGR